MGKQAADMCGQQYYYLTVVGRANNTKRGDARWHCQCLCGNLTTVVAVHLRHGKIKSCGCYRRQSRTTHGLWKHPLYYTWKSMKDRCLNKNNQNYHNYGGRGIKVCDSWQLHPQNFFDDMGEKPSPELSVDRRDNDGNYSCGHCHDCVKHGWTANCRWATAKEQANNTRKNTH